MLAGSNNRMVHVPLNLLARRPWFVTAGQSNGRAVYSNYSIRATNDKKNSQCNYTGEAESEASLSPQSFIIQKWTVSELVIQTTGSNAAHNSEANHFISVTTTWHKRDHYTATKLRFFLEFVVCVCVGADQVNRRRDSKFNKFIQQSHEQQILH